MQVKCVSHPQPKLYPSSLKPCGTHIMYKRLIFLAVLALPGSFFVLAAVGLHPRGRALLVQAAGFGVLRTKSAIARNVAAR